MYYCLEVGTYAWAILYTGIEVSRYSAALVGYYSSAYINGLEKRGVPERATIIVSPPANVNICREAFRSRIWLL